MYMAVLKLTASLTFLKLCRAVQTSKEKIKRLILVLAGFMAKKAIGKVNTTCNYENKEYFSNLELSGLVCAPLQFLGVCEMVLWNGAKCQHGESYLPVLRHGNKMQWPVPTTSVINFCCQGMGKGLPQTFWQTHWHASVHCAFAWCCFSPSYLCHRGIKWPWHNRVFFSLRFGLCMNFWSSIVETGPVGKERILSS